MKCSHLISVYFFDDIDIVSVQFLIQRNAADLILRELQNNPDTWLQVVHILSSTQNLNTKFFALQVSFVRMNIDVSLVFKGLVFVLV